MIRRYRFYNKIDNYRTLRDRLLRADRDIKRVAESEEFK
jgi:hypothetical protein